MKDLHKKSIHFFFLCDIFLIMNNNMNNLSSLKERGFFFNMAIFAQGKLQVMI